MPEGHVQLPAPSASTWLAGARPRTLPAAVSPVLVGCGAAAAVDAFSWWRAVLALVVALALQVGVNYANDYSDGVRGTDAARVGPVRLVGSGLARPAAVRRAAFLAFGVGAAAGLALAASSSWWLAVVGAVSIAAAWLYTGGARPYGYRALGEVSVFLFFGLVAVLGTTYAQAGRLTWLAVLGAVGVGSLACAILVANNLRDIPTDARSGKRTLAVLLGDRRTRLLYAGLVVLAYGAAAAAALAGAPWSLLTLVTVPLAGRLVRLVVGSRKTGPATGPALIPALRDTGLLDLLYAVTLTIGLALS